MSERPPELSELSEHHRIKALLPQRHPLLLVDRVVSVRPGHSLSAVKAVTAAEPCYRDVPDGAPASAYAYPASLLLESLGQAAALLWLAEAGAIDPDHVLMFAGARGYRLLGEAHPGDVLRHDVEMTQVKADTVFATGQTYAGSTLIATADTLIAVRRPRSVLEPATISQ